METWANVSKSAVTVFFKASVSGEWKWDENRVVVYKLVMLMFCC